MDLKLDQLGPKTVIDLEFEKNAQDPITLSFFPTNNLEVLIGTPAGIFNTPRPGQNLVATIPVPSQGVSVVSDLFVESSEVGADDDDPKKITVRVGWPD